MKMKTGPKVLMLAILFIGLGFWAGRGFPRTWEAFVNPDKAPVAGQADNGESFTSGREGGSITSRRVNELESRVADLEKTVDDLRNDVRRAPGASMPSENSEYVSPVPETTAPPAGASPFPSNAPSGPVEPAAPPGSL